MGCRIYITHATIVDMSIPPPPPPCTHTHPTHTTHTQGGYQRGAYNITPDGEAADREEREEILHHEDTDQPTEKETKDDEPEVGGGEGGMCGGWGQAVGRWRGQGPIGRGHGGRGGG